MNKQIRQLFIIILGMFAILGFALSNIQVIQAPSLNADSRNSRSIYHAAEVDRGPIIINGSPVATSVRDDTTKRYQRTYSNGVLYAPVTGFFSSSFGTSTGLEEAAENILDGDSRSLLLQRIRNLFAGKARQGGGINLTIDPELQRVAAEQLGDRRGAVVVLDARTGAIRALYSSPSFDPNALATFDSASSGSAYDALVKDPARPLVNRAIGGDRYAPASTFKILTSIALLEKNAVHPETPVNAPVSILLPGTSTPISNVDSTECGNGNPTFQEAFARSCNTPFVELSTKLTAADLSSVAERFGFGRELSIPLIVSPSYFPEEMDEAQKALSSIGQYSVQATPLQMAMVAQGIAAQGVVMRPYLIDTVVDADLQIQETTLPKEYSSAVSAPIAAQITAMMVDSVNQPYGTGHSMALPGISVAAKTGTAELGGDSSFANGWAIGFAPADNPQLAFAVIVEGDERTPVAFGGVEAGPIARALLEVGLK